MRVWTIQPVSVYEKLKEEKILYTDIRLSSCYNFANKFCEEIKKDGVDVDELDFEVFNVAYDWLKQRMEDKIGKPENATYPWWAWYKRDLRHSKPDLRQSAYGTKGEKLVCIELELNDKDVILSDFDLWHFCISNSWIPNAENEEDFDEKYDWYDSLSKEEQKRLKFESWETIFDIHIDFRPWHERGQWVQATFWELRLEDVRNVQYFTAR